MPSPSAHCNEKPSLQTILSVVSRNFGVSIIDLKSHSRARPAAWARQCYCLLAREHTGLSYHRIAVSIGNRDHSTVLYSVETARERLDIDEAYAERYRQCISDLGVLL